MIIYKTTNLINKKIYIGLDTHNNPTYYGSGTIIKRAIKKYGKQNFKKEILEKCNTKEKLCQREKYWIRKLNSLYPVGYNITYGGEFGDTFTNNPNKEEIRKKNSESQKGEKSCRYNKKYEELFGEERAGQMKEKKRKDMMGNKNALGYHHTKEHNEKIGKSKFGDKNPAKRMEVKEKISKKLKGNKYALGHYYKHSEDSLRKMKYHWSLFHIPMIF